MGDTFASIATSGPLLLGIVVAAVAGLVSFLSPCVLPLVPGYVAYVTGIVSPDVGRRRVLAGGLLFVAGFTVVFVTMGVLAASAGRAVLADHQRAFEIGGGILMLAFALALLGLIPGLQREIRIHRLPAAGLAGAPVFGAVFALSWTPCIGPTIGAVLALGAIGGEPTRAAVLAVAYSLGIGLPFLAFGLGFRWLVRATAVIRQHAVWVTRAGAGLLALIGVALLTGAWGEFVLWLRGSIQGFEVVV
ncbi:MAG TPA: cytochrome c biogenesis protein CcdA [Natronosporangium sp.]